MERVALTFRTASGEALRMEGAVLPLDLAHGSEERVAVVRRFPVGVVGAITPFNFPLNLVAHKVAPAIAVGCPVALKPSSSAPVTALRLGKILLDAGLPAWMLHVLPCVGAEAHQLYENNRVAYLSFTGSPAIGWALKQAAWKKRVTLELGGNAAVIVHCDAKVQDAVDRVVVGAFANAGQSCISVQRIYVHADVYDLFRTKLEEAVRKVVAGDPRDPSTLVGPLVNSGAVERTEEWVKEALDAGGRLLCGGTRTGKVFLPTVLEGVPEWCRIVSQEVFAPVCVIESYTSTDEVIGRVNASDYGLQAGLFTNDAAFIRRAYHSLHVGGVVVNDSSAYRMDSMPYGGVKESGVGREGVRYAMEEMTEAKVLALTF